jgi:hypothetical protein
MSASKRRAPHSAACTALFTLPGAVHVILQPAWLYSRFQATGTSFCSLPGRIHASRFRAPHSAAYLAPFMLVLQSK